jgi:hypothetical protein
LAKNTPSGDFVSVHPFLQKGNFLSFLENGNYGKRRKRKNKQIFNACEIQEEK